MITGYSRYANSTIDLLADPRNVLVLKPTIIPPAPTLRVFNYTEYQVEWGDRIDLISYSFLGDASLWWKIADANPEIFSWINLTPGIVIRIPNVS